MEISTVILDVHCRGGRKKGRKGEEERGRKKGRKEGERKNGRKKGRMTLYVSVYKVDSCATIHATTHTLLQHMLHTTHATAQPRQSKKSI